MHRSPDMNNIKLYIKFNYFIWSIKQWTQISIVTGIKHLGNQNTHFQWVFSISKGEMLLIMRFFWCAHFIRVRIMLLTLWSHVTLWILGLASMEHSKYTSAPSLMLLRSMFWPASKRSRGMSAVKKIRLSVSHHEAQSIYVLCVLGSLIKKFVQIEAFDIEECDFSWLLLIKTFLVFVSEQTTATVKLSIELQHSQYLETKNIRCAIQSCSKLWIADCDFLLCDKGWPFTLLMLSIDKTMNV